MLVLNDRESEYWNIEIDHFLSVRMITRYAGWSKRNYKVYLMCLFFLILLLQKVKY